MLTDIRVLLTSYKFALALSQSLQQGYTDCEAAYQNGKEDMLSNVIDDLQRIVDKTEQFLGR